jgi:hypothetical protein
MKVDEPEPFKINMYKRSDLNQETIYHSMLDITHDYSSAQFSAPATDFQKDKLPDLSKQKSSSLPLSLSKIFDRKMLKYGSIFF